MGAWKEEGEGRGGLVGAGCREGNESEVERKLWEIGERERRGKDNGKGVEKR